MGGGFRLAALAASASLAAVATPAHAQIKFFDIPSQPAEAAVGVLGHQAGIQIIAARRATAGKRTNAVRGNFTVPAALDELLRGTGLAAERTGAESYIIRSDTASDASFKRTAGVAPPSGVTDPATPRQMAQQLNQPEERAASTILPAAAPAAGAGQDVVITGSRIITSGARAPTPVTVVSTEALARTTPSNIPDALNKLPIFQGSQAPRASGGGNTNQASNILSLRNFGAQRTLVLLDGHRVAPSNANGTVSPDVLPQMLVSRVDVVTGGASAVYGSDAVTGVVNFVLDKKFDGLKLNLNSGISNYGDGASYRLGAAYGTSLLAGRGHFIASFERYHRDGVGNFDRPYGPEVWVLTGSGTVANPYTPTVNTRRGDYAFGGKITGVSNCPTSPCTLTSQYFATDGVLRNFNSGIPTGTGNQNNGGDGSYSRYTTALVEFTTDQAFGRFDYDLTDSVNFYVQASYSEAFSTGQWFPVKLNPASGTVTTTNTQGATFFKSNPFLTPAVQSALGNNGRADSSNVFSIGSYINNLGPHAYTGTANYNRNVNLNGGLTGRLGRFRWDIFYAHGENRNRINGLNNANQQNQLAAIDAVVGANGQIQCYAATQAATAARYANCVPLNPFGPTTITQAMLNWMTGTTSYQITNKLDDVGGSIAGDLFSAWAGPIKAALSAEYRANAYKVTSSDVPKKVDCTGLRICNPGLAQWYGDIFPEIARDNHVWEVAAELNVPLLADVRFFKDLTLNLAARHTDYSTSGGVNTWKAGGVWEVTPELRFRVTRSLDIRAPTLDDLYRPLSTQVAGFNDIHTSYNTNTNLITRGNPDLKPEKANTFTAGLVVEPAMLRGLLVSADYYHIKIKNAIGQISGATTSVQQLCEAANGSGQFCSLFTRPLPFSDRSPGNFPTSVQIQNLNASFAEVEGADLEASFVRDAFSLRLFANYQPVNRSQAFSGVPVSRMAGSKTRITAFANYFVGAFRVGIQDNWLSSFSQPTGSVITTPASSSANVYAVPRVPAFNTVDMNLEVTAGRAKNVTLYLAVQNLFNKLAPLTPYPGSVGLYYPVPSNYDIMGRYFTFGIRAKL